MQWNQRLERLEGDVIKTDVMANSNADFMATHMPFKHLTLIMSGKDQANSKEIDEEEIYNTLVKNIDNRHRVIIVRGPNGVGKSHLIRWFNSRLLSDNPKQEEVVFIRRLGNNLRGAVAQLLDAGIVKDEEIEERMRKFINSVDSQDENHFKSTIYYNFIAEIENDTRNEIFTPVEIRDLAAFLNDSRVKDLLIQEHGPISRFYAQIAKPKEVVIGGEAAFVPEDFIFERSLYRDIHNNCSSEARRFLNRLKDEEEKLAQYLNLFTPSVIRRCSDIAQGDAREIFAELRKQLKSQGKCLTVFIEDFTAFTGIDAELITVLSTEHGGEYQDFCRVTAVIGITDAYYDQFKDNFTDRVTHQVIVEERAYGSKEALSHMAALYVNAVFCPRDIIEKWYENGANIELLPVAEIEDNQLPWESIEIGSKKLTLYPFNSNALDLLYNRLQVKTPREFLKNIILNQLGAYLRDKVDGEHTRFPYTDFQGPPIQLSLLSHASYIDELDLSEQKKKRLRVLLSIWGAGHVLTGEAEGTSTIGGLPVKFFELLGFNSLKGLDAVTGVETASTDSDETELQDKVQKPISPQRELSKQEKQYNDYIADIEGWYQNKDRLRYSEYYRARIYDFLATSINWQYEGVAAYLASLRYKSPSLLYIDDQMQEGNRQSSTLCIERIPEHRDVLIGLTMYHYNRGWDFNEAPYFQLQLITWLETVKPLVTNSVKGEKDGQSWPIFKWAMVSEFLRLALMGFLKSDDDYNTTRLLLFDKQNLEDRKIPRNEGKWGKAQELICDYSEDFRKNKDFLIQMENTYMGFVNQAGGTVHFFDSHDIEETFYELQQKEWNLENELPATRGPEILNLSLNLIKIFLPRVNEVLEEEQAEIQETLAKLDELVGVEFTVDNLKIISNTMNDLLTTMNYRGLNYPGILMTQTNMLNKSAEFILQQYTMLMQSLDKKALGSLLRCYSPNPLQQIQDAVASILDIKKLAESKSEEFKSNIAELGAEYGIDDGMVDAAVKELTDLYQKVEALEVGNQ